MTHKFHSLCLLLTILLVGWVVPLSASPLIDSLEQALTNQVIPDTNRCYTLIRLGTAYLDVSPTTARETAEEALALALELGFQKGEIPAYQVMGIAYVHQENFNEAIQFFRKALEVQQKLGRELEEAENLANISGVYMKMGEYDKALSFALRALEIHKKSKKQNRISDMHQILALIYANLEEFEKALAFYQMALDGYEKTNNQERLAQTYFNVGLMMDQQGNHQEARKWLLKAQEIFVQKGLAKGQIDVLNRLGMNAFAKRRYPAAQTYLNQAIRLHRNHEYPGREQNTYFYISRVDSAMGNFRQALAHYRRSANIRDSLSENRYGKELLETKSQLDLSEQKRKLVIAEEKAAFDQAQLNSRDSLIRLQWIAGAIIILLLILLAFGAGYLFQINRQQKTAQQRIQTQNQELAVLNETKDHWFSIISHDFRSPLTFLQSALTLINGGKLNMTETQMLTLELEARVKRTSSLLDNLLYWAQSQMHGITPRPQALNLQTILRENIEFFQPHATKKRITLHIKVDEIVPAWADREMIKLIIRNLMSNAIKFTYPGGNIWLQAWTEHGKSYLVIKDDGCGMPELVKDNLFQLQDSHARVGTAQEKGTGLGLWLAQTFVESNQGSIQVESQEEKGSTFMVELPSHPQD
ncbi:MAG: tetratricopeptide repeat protein [Bacteroidota bacterium]